MRKSREEDYVDYFETKRGMQFFASLQQVLRAESSRLYRTFDNVGIMLNALPTPSPLTIDDDMGTQLRSPTQPAVFSFFTDP